ncbi:MAG: ATP phosphoribosyltransferase regulatory subunit [Acetobacter sp.]|nr:ATP phosphoribosyltransferase regulatory subunit [Acetobacter sp.]
MTCTPENTLKREQVRNLAEKKPFRFALLPNGFVDLLTTDARTEAYGVSVLMESLIAHGYDPVKPPLMEFEETYLVGAGATLSAQSFRVMDPDSRRMMVLRADITPQIARMAATRARDVARPLRVSYAGTCVVVTPVATGERGREIMQVGMELIGLDTPEADVEVISIAAEALERLGVRNVSFDLTMPPLVPMLLEEADIPEARRKKVYYALARKDAVAVVECGGVVASSLIALLEAGGTVEHALRCLKAMNLPQKTQQIADRFLQTVTALRKRCPDLGITVDLVECRGWQYHTGVCVSLFAQGCSEELGRGGRYLCNDEEPACGLTFRPDVLFRLMPPAPPRERVYLAQDADQVEAACLRQKGYVTIGGFTSGVQAVEEARRLGCAFILSGTICHIVESMS